MWLALQPIRMPGSADPPLVEIIPLDKPYALWTGNVFRGVVTCKGEPVPDAE